MMENIADYQADITRLLRKEGRALAISLPEKAYEAAREFKQVFEDLSLEGQVFVAHKATDRTSVVAGLVNEIHTGVDIASIGELEACLAHDIAAENIIVTGPKSTHLLARAVEVGVRAIVLDSYNELERLIALGATRYPDVLIRLSRSMINRPGVSRLSRFGFDNPSYDKALSLLSKTPNIRLLGLAFHLDTKSTDEKIYAAHTALGLLVELPDQGFMDATVLDIGGGFGHDYGLTNSELDTFDVSFRKDVYSGTLNTYQSMSYGLKKLQSGQVVGDYTPMDIPSFPVATERLRAIFAADSFAERANELLITIWCEPGSALFAEAGIVASEIIDVTARDGRMDVTLNIQHGQVLFDRNEVLVDPVHLPATPSKQQSQKGYLLGILCMENDILSHRPIHFKQHPQPGDLLIWPATGAYRMHMSQTNAIMHPDMARYRYENQQFIKDEQ